LEKTNTFEEINALLALLQLRKEGLGCAIGNECNSAGGYSPAVAVSGISVS
jgi:hypothetical protein